MSTIPALLFSFAVALASTAAAAQTEAVFSDQRVIKESTTGRTDTIVVRAVTSRKGFRLDVLSATPSAVSLLQRGRSELMTFGDSGMTIIFMDPAKQIYTDMNSSALLAMGAAATSVKFEPAGDSATVDSVGPGPTIVGHKTIQFRAHLSARVTMSLFGDTTTHTIAVTTDLYLAPDLQPDLAGRDSAGSNAAAARIHSMLSALPGLESAIAYGAKMTRRFATHGTPLKTITATTLTTAAGISTTHSSMETLSYEKRTAPDSLFRVPAAYRKVGLIDFVSGF